MPAKVFHAHLWGTRKHKYARLRESSTAETDWTELDPDSPFYLLVPQNKELIAEYRSAARVCDVMPINGMGITSARDRMVTDFDASPLVQRAELFRSSPSSDRDVCEELGVALKKGWDIPSARATLRNEDDLRALVEPVEYRPFDRRLILYHDSLVWRPVRQLMCHLRQPGNLAIVSFRAIRELPWAHVFVGKHLFMKEYASGLDNCFGFPVYVYPQLENTSSTQRELLFAGPFPPSPAGRVPNLSPEFVAAMAERLGLTFVSDGVGDLGLGSAGAARNAAVPAARASGDAGVTRSAAVPAAGASGDAGSAGTFGPEDVFHYIYAVFHAPTYRARYAEFLKIDFPRVPLTSDLELFRALCGLGADLVALHLLEDDYAHASWVKAGEPCPLASPITRYPVPGDNTVAKGHPKYLPPGTQNPEPGTRNPLPSGRVYISKDDRRAGTQGQYFEGVPPEVWGFHIGGYQVCEKWLKDRRGRRLSFEDLTHYQRVVVALRETIRLMSEVDAAIEAHGGWPIR